MYICYSIVVSIFVSIIPIKSPYNPNRSRSRPSRDAVRGLISDGGSAQATLTSPGRSLIPEDDARRVEAEHVQPVVVATTVEALEAEAVSIMQPACTDLNRLLFCKVNWKFRSVKAP